MGEAARTVGLVFFVVVAGVVLTRHLARKKGAETGVLKFAASKAGAVVMAGALLLSAAAATATITIAGHQGAKLVWEQKSGG